MEPEAEGGDERLDFARKIVDRYRKNPNAPTHPRHTRRPAQRSAPRRSTRDDPVTVGQAFGELIREQGWGAQLDAQRVFSDWAGIVGPDIAEHSQVVGFADTVVHVQTTSTAWAKEMRLLAPRIVARLNEVMGDGSVTLLDIRGPEAPSWKSGPWSVKGRGPRDTYG